MITAESTTGKSKRKLKIDIWYREVGTTYYRYLCSTDRYCYVQDTIKTIIDKRIIKTASLSEKARIILYGSGKYQKVNSNRAINNQYEIMAEKDKDYYYGSETD